MRAGEQAGQSVVCRTAPRCISWVAVGGARPRPRGYDGRYRHGVLASAVTNSAVITEEGVLLGRINGDPSASRDIIWREDGTGLPQPRPIDRSCAIKRPCFA